MDRNQSPQGETARILVEFLEVAITSIVFLKGVYPIGAFERRRYMNVVVQIDLWCYSCIVNVLEDQSCFSARGLVERVAVIFSDSNNLPLERFVFKINVNQSYGLKLEEADLEFSLKSFFIKLPLSQSLMKVLPSALAFGFWDLPLWEFEVSFIIQWQLLLLCVQLQYCPSGMLKLFGKCERYK